MGRRDRRCDRRGADRTRRLSPGNLYLPGERGLVSGRRWGWGDPALGSRYRRLVGPTFGRRAGKCRGSDRLLHSRWASHSRIFGACNYDPGIGRFISVDPLLETTDTNQLGGYAYAGDNPIAHSDPTSQSWWSKALKVAAIVVVVVAVIAAIVVTGGAALAPLAAAELRGTHTADPAAPTKLRTRTGVTLVSRAAPGHGVAPQAPPLGKRRRPTSPTGGTRPPVGRSPSTAQHLGSPHYCRRGSSSRGPGVDALLRIPDVPHIGDCAPFAAGRLPGQGSPGLEIHPLRCADSRHWRNP